MPSHGRSKYPIFSATGCSLLNVRPTAQKSWYETAGPAKSKAKNNDWYAAGYKDGLANTKTKYMLETFKNKKATKIGVTTWIWYDNKKNPDVAEIWAVAK
ncbi:hypothetical protein [Glutamicibacter ardleyensis]|uniref:hypothetical protein n=1 Tax=Glutamicibacter ardleyensis TaxID=225894 RepID=UPI003FD62D3A